MTPSTITSPEVRRRKLLDDAIQNPTQGGPSMDHMNSAMNQASPAVAQAVADAKAKAAANPLTAGIAQQAAPKPETELIGGVPHMKLPEKKYPGPVGMLGGAMASTIGFAATAPFGDRAADYREASRAGLDTSDEIRTAEQAKAKAGLGAKATPPTTSTLAATEKPNLITDEYARALYEQDMKRSGGIFGTMDMAGANASMARANAVRQQMIDAQPRGGASILGGLDAQGRTRQERENDEKSARWRQDELMQKAKYAPQVVAGAVQGDAQQGVEETRQQGIMAGVGAQQRGQDIQAQTEAARIAGNPADNSLKTAQAQLAGINVNRAQAEAGLLAEAQDPNTPPERRKALITSMLAAQGKSPNENRYIPTTEKIYESGMVTGERARVFDKEAGKFADADQKPPLADTEIQRIARETGLAADDIRARADLHRSGWKIKTLEDATTVDVLLAIAGGKDPEQIRAAINRLGGDPADYGLKN